MSRKSKYTYIDCTNAGRLYIKQNKKPPTRDEWDKRHILPSSNVIQVLYGTWADFIIELGYKPRYFRKIKDYVRTAKVEKAFKGD